MTDRDTDPMGNESGHPYGSSGEEIGGLARHMLDLFSQDIDPAHGYHDDAEALSFLLDIDAHRHHIRATGEVSMEEMEEFDQHWKALDAALPITGPERSWLAMRFVWGTDPYYDSVAKDLGGQEAEIVSGGIRRVLRGDDLLKRWIDWRRQAGDYANQGTLDLAREALRGIVEKLVLYEDALPPSYVILRQIDTKQETE
jgi:hypothetical protein